MSDFIRREDAIKAMSETLKRVFPEHQEIAEKCINALPSAESKHGHWDIEISHDGYQATYHCSECGHQFKWIYDPHFPPVFNYCKSCGARTDEC